MEVLFFSIIAAASIVTGIFIGQYISGKGESISPKTIESLQREKEIAFRESVSLRKEIDRITKEREEERKQFEEELSKRTRQLQVQIIENRRLSDNLSILQLEKKSLENRIGMLESKIRSSIPREMIRSVSEAEKILSQIRDFFQTGEIKNYRLLTSEEHDKVFARIFAESDKVFLTSPFITEDAVTKRLPEMESFIDRNGSLFLVLGREWNTVRFGDEGLLKLVKTLSSGNGKVKLFADNIHHKVLAGERTAVITSYNFLSKNNRLREIGIEIDDANLARRIIDLEIENLKNSQTARKLVYKEFTAVKVERSTSGKTYRVETDADDIPRLYFPLEIEPNEGTCYEAVVMQQIEGSYAQVITARSKEEKISQ